MQLELVSHSLCPYVHRAGIILREKGVAYTQRYVDLNNKPAWLLAVSPRGTVPVLVADGVALFESAAIVEFIDETHPPRLIADDPFERARERAWVEVASGLLSAQFRLSVAPDREAVEAATTAVTTALARYEEALADGRIGARGFGLVDVSVAPAMYRFVVLERLVGVSLTTAHPRVDAWARSLAGRPSVTESVPEDFAELWRASMLRYGGHLARSAAA